MVGRLPAAFPAAIPAVMTVRPEEEDSHYFLALFPVAIPEAVVDGIPRLPAACLVVLLEAAIRNFHPAAFHPAVAWGEVILQDSV